MCAKFRFSISSRSDDIVAEVKGGNFMPSPPAAGGWRGGPAAAGLSGGSEFLLHRTNSSSSTFFSWYSRVRTSQNEERFKISVGALLLLAFL